MSNDAVEQIDVFTKWLGFADPPLHAAKLVILREGDRYRRLRLLEGHTDYLPATTTRDLLDALARPLVRELDPQLFDLPQSAIARHFGSMWTNDSPAHLVRITFSSGRITTICTESQHAFMLPLKVSAAESGGSRETYDPRLSRALAALLPDGYLEKERLGGQLGMLEHDIKESESECQPADIPAVVDNADPAVSPATTIEEEYNEIFRILSGEESAAEKEESERLGKISERLLRRISAQDAADLIARGANPNIADENGQTALMTAAWPPFDRERFRLLAAAGADLEARRFDSFTGLQLACAGGEARAVFEWVAAGADIHARTSGGATPLMLAASWADIVPILLRAGADVNAVDQDGHSAIVYAIHKQSWVHGERHLEAMQALIAAGAALNCRDRTGATPLGHARRVLARVRLQDEVLQAFHPEAPVQRPLDWDDRRMAEAVLQLIISAGGED
jgi:hypothetical protein